MAYGEFLVGLALIVGLFTRLSVLFGVFMNLTFLMAGVSSTNPQMLLLGLGLAAFGSTAGEYGVDRWVLPWLQTKAGDNAVRFAESALYLVLVVFGGWLAWIITDGPTWLAALIVASLALLCPLWEGWRREANPAR